MVGFGNRGARELGLELVKIRLLASKFAVFPNDLQAINEGESPFARNMDE